MNDLIMYAGEVALAKARKRSPLAQLKYTQRQQNRMDNAIARGGADLSKPGWHKNSFKLTDAWDKKFSAHRKGLAPDPREMPITSRYHKPSKKQRALIDERNRGEGMWAVKKARRAFPNPNRIRAKSKSQKQFQSDYDKKQWALVRTQLQRLGLSKARKKRAIR